MKIVALSDFSQKMFQTLEAFVDEEPDGLFFHKKEWLQQIFPAIAKGENASFGVVENSDVLALFPLFILNRTKAFHRIAYHSPVYSAFPLYKKTLSEKKLSQVIALIQEHLQTFKSIIIRGHQSPFQVLSWPRASLWDFLGHSRVSFRAHQIVFLENYSLKKDAVSSFYRYISRATKVLEPVIIAQDLVSKLELLENVLDCYSTAYLQKNGTLGEKEEKRNLYTELLKSRNACLYCLTQKGKVVSYAIVLQDKQKKYAYYSDGFTLREKEYWGANSLLQSSVMENLQRQGYLFYDLSAVTTIQNAFSKDQENAKKRIHNFKRDMGAKVVFAKQATYATSGSLVNSVLSRFV